MENLLRIGKLKAHAVTKIEIERLFASADRALVDAAKDSNGADTRFGLAYRAVMQVAMAAMMASGFRPATSEPGHHQLLIQSLPKTAGIEASRIKLLDAIRTMRNRADYSGDPVSDAIATETLEEARRLVADVRAWMRAHRPELIASENVSGA